MDKKLFRNIIAAICAISVLSIGCYMAFKWEPETDITKNLEQVEQEDIVAFELKDEKIRSVEVINKSGVFTIIESGDDYTVKEIKGQKINSLILNNAVNNLNRITAKKIIRENADNLAEFGLKNPLATVNITASQKHNIIIGDKSPVDDGYYVTIDNRDTVYFISSTYVDYYLNSVDLYRDKTIASIDISSFNLLEIYNGKDKVVSIKKNNSAERQTNIADNKLIMDYPYHEYVRSNNLISAFEDYMNITAIKVETGKNEDYGIGKYMLKITDSNKTHTIVFGNIDSEGNVYAKYSDSENIFTIDKKLFDVISTFEPFEYIYKFAHIFSIENVSEVSFTINDKKYVISALNKKYSVNSSEINYDKYKKIYQLIIGIMITSHDDSSNCGNKVGEAIFKLDNGNTKIIEYFECDERNYAVKRKDGNIFRILKKNIDDIPEQIDLIINN